MTDDIAAFTCVGKPQGCMSECSMSSWWGRDFKESPLQEDVLDEDSVTWEVKGLLGLAET